MSKETVNKLIRQFNLLLKMLSIANPDYKNAIRNKEVLENDRT